MKKIFKDIDDFYRKYIFEKTKELIDLVNLDKDESLIIMYTEPDLLEEAKKLFETNKIKIQDAGDNLSDQGYASCYYL